MQLSEAAINQLNEEAWREAKRIVARKRTLTYSINTDDELWEACRDVFGIEIAREQVCPGHVAPFQAFADAYFARYPTIIWKASRGFGGKSLMLATLAFAESLFLGAGVTLLGGSGQQSERVHAYMSGSDPQMRQSFINSPGFPQTALHSQTTKYTKLVNGGRVDVLMASQKSVRGPHPQRLRMDEADEMDIDLLDAALGQPMATEAVREQTVISSTHQYPDKTMTEVLKRAAEKSFPVMEWCWRESATAWLSMEEVERKRAQVTAQMWATEYDLQEPSPEGRAIMPAAVERMFNRDLGEWRGGLQEYIQLEPPIEGATYSTGADWARTQDFTVIVTLRTDVYPFRVVSFIRTNREPWPVMVSRFDAQVERYDGRAHHDATGLGDVVHGYLQCAATPVKLVGAKRTQIINDYVTAIENNEIEAPMIEFMMQEHRYASQDDLYGSGHLPDSICAGALAYRGARGRVYVG